MAYQIIGVDIIASYDSLSSLPGSMRPTPSHISAKVSDKVAMMVELEDVIDEARQLAPFTGDLPSAASMARKAVETLLTNHIISGSGLTGVELHSTSLHYRITSTGSHEVVTWMQQMLSSGLKFWPFAVEINGEAIKGYACLAITLSETSAGIS